MNLPLFKGADVGAPKLTGATIQTGAKLEITAGGRDIWNQSDECHFAAIPVEGDFELSARLDSLSMADLYTKAGLMLRASDHADSPHAFLLAFGSNQARNKNNGGLEFQYRTDPGGDCVGIYPPQPLSVPPDFPADFPAVWLRLARNGASITAAFSTDGDGWKTFCEHETNLPSRALLGFAVTSHNIDQTVRGVFTSLSFAGAVHTGV